ncbi:MAG: hypothetical protein CMN79_01795 [Spirochaetales bacterium]|mgnify:FL=1|jgi:hypothetical protein|nr:hypothetical protein [Spirochaetales bacterium]|tara:strand:- start:2710 stop:3501 length:792 start_codon:yes stop_codon:yes gene_type:complete
MPKKAALFLYHNLENINEDKSYWERYIKFHELYWDGPASSQGVFYGREYEEYRESLSKYLEIEINQIKDCLFTKHDNGKYYVSLLGSDSDKNILEHDNFIPPEWFLLFASSEKRLFYSHAGDGAIHPDGIFYSTDSASSKIRLEEVRILLEDLNNEDIPKDLGVTLKELAFNVSEISFWVSSLPDDSMLVLNYAELNKMIHQLTLKNEDSVQELWLFIKLVKEGDYGAARSCLKVYQHKWDEISEKCMDGTYNPHEIKESDVQ